MGRTIGVGMLGLGTVGSGVARLLVEQGPRLAKRAGAALELRGVAVRDPGKARGFDLPDRLVTSDPRRVLDDPGVAIVVEVMGGIRPALGYLMDALAAGKDVVTANKALLAEHGAELFAAARRSGRAIAFEGAVGGGIPIIQALAVGLGANQVQSLAAILNGTCNFILTAMSVDGSPYAEALARAQGLGYAEADPALDVDGTDTAHKLAVLAQLAFGASVTTAQIPREGIDRLQGADIAYAAELGYAVKLLATARASDLGLDLRVAPTLVRRGTPMADVAGPYNAVRVVGDAVGDAFFHGRGAGAMPTASAVVGDVIDVAVGRAALTARALDLWPEAAAPARLVGDEGVRKRYYLRFTIADRPGVIAAIAGILGDHGISIASLIQHDPGDEAPAGAPVPLVMMSHVAVEADLRRAIREVDRLDVVRPPTICLGVED